MIVNILAILSCCFSGKLVFAVTGDESDLQSAYQLLPNTPIFDIDDMSYYIANHTPATFNEAIQICEMMNMRLATVKSESLNNKLYEYMKSWNIATKSNFYVSGSNMVDGKTWLWMTTGERIEYFNWNKGQPDGNQYCLDLYYIKNSGLSWWDVNCERRFSYICERPKNLHCRGLLDKRHQHFTHINDTSCCGAYKGDLPLIEEKGMTYYLETVEKLSKSDAENFCNYHQMQLVTINNQEENSILRDVLLRYGKTDNGYWTSGEKVNGKWLWGDEEPIEYFNWGPGEPNNRGSKENCIDIFERNDNVIWNDSPCTKKRNFICQKHSNPQECT